MLALGGLLQHQTWQHKMIIYTDILKFYFNLQITLQKWVVQNQAKFLSFLNMSQNKTLRPSTMQEAEIFFAHLLVSYFKKNKIIWFLTSSCSRMPPKLNRDRGQQGPSGWQRQRFLSPCKSCTALVASWARSRYPRSQLELAWKISFWHPLVSKGYIAA